MITSTSTFKHFFNKLNMKQLAKPCPKLQPFQVSFSIKRSLLHQIIYVLIILIIIVISQLTKKHKSVDLGLVQGDCQCFVARLPVMISSFCVLELHVLGANIRTCNDMTSRYLLCPRLVTSFLL